MAAVGDGKRVFRRCGRCGWADPASPNGNKEYSSMPVGMRDLPGRNARIGL
jgi:hypothetical protein